ncbi:hypothetical protein RhiirA5_441187 [Rhizophagus irregularis]|uniref:Uncharacterized protein n=1 Tax=Rhizophagus irregularis TaxID=588596 RepID=A0A2N0NFY3_9GLOM|nr:hypothetical protein RhiirA5_441187 [Rhizophagus irregularis]
MTKLVEIKERINLEKEEEIKIITGPENSKKKKIDTSLSNKKVKDSSEEVNTSFSYRLVMTTRHNISTQLN